MFWLRITTEFPKKYTSLFALNELKEYSTFVFTNFIGMR